MLKATFFALLSVSFVNACADNYERQVIQKRIAPVGQVRLQQDKVENNSAEQPSAEKPQKVAEAKVPGEATYKQYCSVCHLGGLAGAPKFRNKADWKARLAKMNIDELTASAIKGKNAMPAKGTCMGCTEKEIKDAVQYMLPKDEE